MNQVPIVLLITFVATVAPNLAAAYVQDPYPINANDNRNVFEAAVNTALTLGPGRAVYPISAIPQSGVATSYPNVPAVVWPASEITTPRPYGHNFQAPTQTYAGSGVSSFNYPPQTQNFSYLEASSPWISNLPYQSLTPSSVVASQPFLVDPRLTSFENNYSVTYANSLPQFYGANTSAGVYTVYGGQSYDANAIYSNGLARATGANSTVGLNRAYRNMPQTGGSGQWVQSPGGWVQPGARQVTRGHLPW